MCMLNQYLPIITLYNKQNFVQQVFAQLAVKSGPTLTCLVISDLVSVGCWTKMALNPNYEAIGKAFTTQYYQVLQGFLFICWSLLYLSSTMLEKVGKTPTTVNALGGVNPGFGRFVENPQLPKNGIYCPKTLLD